MKYNKGMWLDGDINQNPTNTTRQNKNLVLTNSYGSITNELGFKKSLQFNKTVLKIHPIDKGEFVVFMPNEIGTIKNDVYKPKLVLPDTIGNIQDVVYYINNNGERIVIFNSNHEPKCVNIDSGVYNTKYDLSLNNYSNSAILKTDVENEGSLKAGAYYVIYCYEKDDKSTTNWFKNDNPVYITNDNIFYTYQNYDGVESGEASNKSISLSFSNLNTNYKNLKIGVVYQQNKTLNAYYIKTLKTETNVKTVITGTEVFEQLTLNDVIVDSFIFKTVENITLHNKNLIIGDFNKFKEPSQQTKVNNLIVNWYSEKTYPLGKLSIINNHRSSDKYHYENHDRRSFCHGEVYAIYIRFEYIWGYGKWYLLSNRVSKGDEMVEDTVINYKSYQVNDSCSVIGLYGNGVKGEFSYWENEDEPYPNNGEYPSGNVRHFKFPSLNWCKNNLYNDTSYGGKYFDKLGIVLENLNLDDYQDCYGNKALSYRIGYAKRNNINNRIIDQSVLVANLKNINNKENNNLTSVGVNHLVDFTFSNNPAGTSIKTIDKTNYSNTDFRTYPFALLRNKQKVYSNFILKEWIFDGNTDYYRYDKDYSIFDRQNQSHPIVGKTDYTNHLCLKTPYGLTPVLSTNYIANNVISGKHNNLYLEEFLNLEVDSTKGDLLLDDIYTSSNLTDSYNNPTNVQNINEKNVLITFMNVAKNYYFDFRKQIIVDCGQNDTNLIFGGDSYICDYSFMNYGDTKTMYSSDIKLDSERCNVKTNGVRTTKRFLCESQMNINLRFISSSETFKLNTSYYPKISTEGLISSGNTGLLQILERDKNPNDFVNGYTEDMNAQNLLQLNEVYDYNKEDEDYRYTIAKSQPLTFYNINKLREFRENDLYSFIDKTKGKMINLKSTNEYLYIHFENTLYMTRPVQNLETDNNNIIKVGIGDIFDNEPVELIHDELGQLGTQHKTSCYLSLYGYVFYDSQKGIWWIVDRGRPENISSNGLHNYFRDNNHCYDDKPFMSQGFNITYDEKFERFIISRKYKKLNSEMIKRFKGVWISDQNFVNSLVAGDIVFKDGKYKIIQ